MKQTNKCPHCGKTLKEKPSSMPTITTFEALVIGFAVVWLGFHPQFLVAFGQSFVQQTTLLLSNIL